MQAECWPSTAFLAAVGVLWWASAGCMHAEMWSCQVRWRCKCVNALTLLTTWCIYIVTGILGDMAGLVQQQAWACMIGCTHVWLLQSAGHLACSMWMW